MENKLYLSELFKSNYYEFKEDQLNLIIAPCGSGKSYYILTQHLQSNHNVIYVSNTTALKEQVIRDYALYVASELDIPIQKVLVEKTSEYGSYLTWSSDVYFHPDFTYCNSIFITYQSLVNRLHTDTLYFDEFSTLMGEKTTIILDEAHDIVRYSEKFDDGFEGNYNGKGYHCIEEWLSNKETYKKYQIIGLTATPQNLENYHDVLGNDKHLLKCYSQRQVINYSEPIVDVLDKLTINEKNKVVMFVSGSIEQMILLTDSLKQKGHKAECLWSKNNSYKYTDKQQQVYTELITNGNISLIDILIVNSAFESGVNVYDLDIKTIIYNYKPSHQDDISFEQCIGRVRHDADLLLVRRVKKEVKKIDRDMLQEELDKNMRIKILNEYKDKRLSTKEFKELCEKLNFRDKSSNRLSTTSTTINPKIKLLGFEILDKRDKTGRYKIILSL